MALLTEEQLAHLKAHQAEFDEFLGEGDADITAYFGEHDDEFGPGSLYVTICDDLELEPVGQPQVTWTFGLEDARKLYDYLHHNRPGGYQHVHDSLLDAIREAADA